MREIACIRSSPVGEVRTNSAHEPSLEDDHFVCNSYISTLFHGCSSSVSVSSFPELSTMNFARVCPSMVVYCENLILNSLSSISHCTILSEESRFCRKGLSGLSARTVIS